MVSDFYSLDRQGEGSRQGNRVMRLHLQMSTFQRRESGSRQLRRRGELRLREACTHAEVEELEIFLFKRNKLSYRNTKNGGGARQRVDLRRHLSDFPGAHGSHADVSESRKFATREARMATRGSKAFRVEPPQDLATHTRSLVSRAPVTRTHCAALTSVGVSMRFYIDIVDRRVRQ